jgi:hypothetical protein
VSIMLPPDSAGNNGTPGWRAYDLTPEIVAPLLERFGWYHERRGEDECWIWGGPYFKTTGYGKISRSSRHRTGQHILAHRFAWVAGTGQSLTDDITIDHLCVNRLCVNPSHMEPVTLSVNAARRNQRPVGERVYSRVTEYEVDQARHRAGERAAAAHSEKVRRDRAAYAARRAEPAACDRCGRAVRRDNLRSHVNRGCRLPGRPRRVGA